MDRDLGKPDLMTKFSISFFDIFDFVFRHFVNCRYLLWSKCQKNYTAIPLNYSVMHFILNHTYFIF